MTAKAKAKGKKAKKGTKAKKAKKAAKKGMKVAKDAKGKPIKGAKVNEAGFRFIAPGAVILDPKILVRPEVSRTDAKFKELVESVKKLGTLIQPIVLNMTKKGARLVCGRQRLDAARIAKLKSVPYITVEGTDDELLHMGLDENEARVPMSVVQEAQVMQRAAKLLKKSTGKTPSNVKLANALGRSPRWVADHLGLLDLPAKVQSALDENAPGEVTIGKCHELMRVHPKDREQLVPAMKKLSLNPFRHLLEKKAKDGDIRWAKGKSKPRTEAGKKAKSKGVGKAEKAIYTGKKVKEKGAQEAEVDMKTPNQVIKLIKVQEKAILSETKKKSPDKVELAHARGQMTAYLTVLNLPVADSLKGSLNAHDKKNGKKAAKKASKKKSKPKTKK